MVLTTSRRSTWRGRPTRWTGIKGSTRAHWASVRSERYGLRIGRRPGGVAPGERGVFPTGYGNSRYPDSLLENDSKSRIRERAESLELHRKRQQAQFKGLTLTGM